MNFLKNFFKDDSIIVGLCGFKSMKPGYCSETILRDRLFAVCDNSKIFQTDYAKNMFLRV